LAPKELLLEVWIKLTGLPKRMRREDWLMAGMQMVGRPIFVEAEYIHNKQTVCMLIACRNPLKVKSTIQIFHKN
jgi:hypothetical protein